MYSSLSSASKLYGGGAKNKQKSGTTGNVKKRKKKSKLLPALHPNAVLDDSHSSTLIGALIKIKKETDSQSVDSENESTLEEDTPNISFCTPQKVQEIEKNDEVHSGEFSAIPDNIKSLSHKNTNIVAVETLNNVDLNDGKVKHDDSCSERPEEIPFDADQSMNELQNQSSVIVTSAEVHHSALSDSQSCLNSEGKTDSSDYEEEPTVVQNPMIIISPSDSVKNLSDLNDECTGNETATALNNESEAISDNLPTSKSIGVGDDSVIENIRPPLLNKGLKAETIDNVSMLSDCCMSKNIYNEYSTENVDESDQAFIIDSKVNSLEEDSYSSDCEEPLNTVLVSPEASEISATESSNCDNTKTTPPDVIKTETTTVHTIINNDPELMKDEEFMFDPVQVLMRSQSLPHYIDLVESENALFNENFSKKSSTKVNYASDIAFQKLMDQKLPDYQKEKVSGVKRSSESGEGLHKSQSVESSETSLSTGSSCACILPPVTTKEARQRSFVVGNLRASGSLLGVEELSRFFPDKKVNVFIGTWNMNGQDPPEAIDDFLLPLRVSYVPDIYAVGVQEASQSRSEWEVLMQTTIGPSHVLLTSTSLGVLHLAVFIRRDLIWFCSEPEDAYVTTRPGSMVKTKGAVAISFLFFGTSFLFINSHLTAHEKKLKERVADYEKICTAMDLPKKIPLKPQYQSKDVTSRFDNVFWCGDLNFRVVHNRPSVLRFVEEKLMQTLHTCDFLLQHDQLHQAMSEGVAFHGFREGVINFVPSYKFDIGTCFFNSTKQRIPSYTDRVLYRCKKIDSVLCTHYNTVSNILTSDHKPVFAVFEVSIRPGRDNIPLAAGSFRRDVYVEANKRRATALDVSTNHRNSTVCCIM